MPYTVGEMAKMLDVPASTLRYYDKEGLLPFVARSSGGIRLFQDSDLEWLRVIGCMKKAGMSIKDIRQYIELAMQGNDTIDTRLAMFRHQREVLEAQMAELQHHEHGGLQVLVLRNGAGHRHHRHAEVYATGADPGAVPRHPAGTAENAGEVRPSPFRSFIRPTI